MSDDGLRDRLNDLAAARARGLSRPAVAELRARGRARTRRRAGAAAALCVVLAIAVPRLLPDRDQAPEPVAPIPPSTTRPAVTTTTVPATTTTAARSRAGGPAGAGAAPGPADPAGGERSGAPAATSSGSKGGNAGPGGPRPRVGRGGIVLRRDGPGVVRLGEDAETAVVRLTRALGKPWYDSGWKPAAEMRDGCAGELQRVVEWDEFSVFLTDGVTRFAPGGGRHLYGYWVTNHDTLEIDATTPAGLGLRDTLTDLRAAYPGRVELIGPNPMHGGFTYRVNAEGGGPPDFLVSIDDTTALENGTGDPEQVDAIVAGATTDPPFCIRGAG
jgi:hypothetical protein